MHSSQFFTDETWKYVVGVPQCGFSIHICQIILCLALEAQQTVTKTCHLQLTQQDSNICTQNLRATPKRIFQVESSNASCLTLKLHGVLSSQPH